MDQDAQEENEPPPSPKRLKVDGVPPAFQGPPDLRGAENEDSEERWRIIRERAAANKDNTRIDKEKSLPEEEPAQQDYYVPRQGIPYEDIRPGDLVIWLDSERFAQVLSFDFKKSAKTSSCGSVLAQVS